MSTNFTQTVSIELVAANRNSDRRPLVAAFLIAAVVKNTDKGNLNPVSTEKTVVKTITQLVKATCSVKPAVAVKISPKDAGEIIGLPFRNGTIVTKGTLAVLIKPGNCRYQIEQQEANLSAAKATAIQSNAQLPETQDDFKRIENAVWQSGFLFWFISHGNQPRIRRAQSRQFTCADPTYQRSANQFRNLLSKSIYAAMDDTINSHSSKMIGTLDDHSNELH